MTSWDGLPDFGAPIAGGPVPMFAGYNASMTVRAMPVQVVVATLRDGSPDFRVDLIRSSIASKPPWGALRVRVALRCDIDACLAAVRAQMPGASVAPAQPSGGFARLVSGGGPPVPADLGAVRAFDWMNLAAAQLVVPDLSADSVSFVKQALLDQTLAIWTRLEIEVPGVAARAAATVDFSPKQLLARIVPAGRCVAWDDFVAGLSRGAGALAIDLDGEPVEPRRLGEILGDRIRMAWGKLTASEAGDIATIEFADPAALPDRVRWDLRTVVDARRPFAIQLDPLDAPRAMAAKSGLAQLVTEHTEPALPTGVWAISVAANLPERRENVVAIGATLRAAANPPARAQDIVQTIELDASTRRGGAQIRLGPREPLAYTLACYVVLQLGAEIRRLDGAARPHTEWFVDLGPADFPVAFIPISASSSLLADADVTGSLTYTDADATAVELPFALSQAVPATSLPLPAGCTGTWSLTATPLDGRGRPLALGPLPAAPLSLGPWSFPAYGPHQIAITAAFPAGVSSMAIDLLAESQDDTPQNVSTIWLTPDAPTATWRYFATSPFRAGYRYRSFASSGPRAPWSEPQPADAMLAVTADPGASATSFEIDGVHCYVDPSNPTFLRYLPRAPIPARAPSGHPLLSLINLGAAGSILQLSVRYDVEDIERDRLRAALAAGHAALASALLQPAQIHVTQWRVDLVAAPGAQPTVLGTNTGSGMPPWDAIFSIRLTGDQAPRVARALAGETGILTITVHADVSPELAGTLPDRPSSIDRTTDVATLVATG